MLHLRQRGRTRNGAPPEVGGSPRSEPHSPTERASFSGCVSFALRKELAGECHDAEILRGSGHGEGAPDPETPVGRSFFPPTKIKLAAVKCFASMVRLMRYFHRLDGISPRRPSGAVDYACDAESKGWCYKEE